MRAVIFVLWVMISLCDTSGSYASDDVKADYQNRLFNCHATSEEEYNRSIEYWNNEAKKGSLKTARGMCSLARQKCHGIIGNIALIKERCLELAEKGEREAQKITALMLMESPSVSLKWHLKAALQNPKMKALIQDAEKGDAEAEFEMGVYFNSLDPLIGTDDMLKWWHRAANQNHARAQLALATIYYNGCGTKLVKGQYAQIGVCQNLEESYFWHKLAQRDYPTSKAILYSPRRLDVYKKLNPEQVEKVNGRIRDWKPVISFGRRWGEEPAPDTGWIVAEARH